MLAKLGFGLAVALFGLLSLNLDLGIVDNDPDFNAVSATCDTLEVTIDYTAHGGPNRGYDYRFTVWHRAADGSVQKVGQAHGPGLPHDQRYIVSVPLNMPGDGRAWAEGAQFYVTVNSKGPDNISAPFACTLAGAE